MWVMEPVPFIRRHASEPALPTPWEERRALEREVSWQERMTKVGASEVDRERAAETLRLLQPKLVEARGRVSALNRKLVAWVAIALGAAVSLVLNGRAILTIVLR